MPWPKGRKQSPEHRAATSRAMMENTHLLGYRHTPETKARMSAVRMGNTNGLAHSRTAAWRAKMRGNTFGLGYKHTEEAKARIGQASRARHHTQETRIKMSESAVKRRSRTRNYTIIQLDLANFLSDAGLNIALEVPFGQACVDIYLPDHHLAVEADGEYWHELTERERPGYYARRDAELLRRFDLPVARFTGAEIGKLVA